MITDIKIRIKPAIFASGIFISMAMVYVLLNMILPGKISWYNLAYVVSPLLWLIIAIEVLIMSALSNQAKLKFTSSLLTQSLIIGTGQILLLIIAGFFFVFGKSPYSFSAKGVIINLLVITSILSATELTRAYLINTFTRRYFALGILFISLFCAFINLPFARLTGFNEPRQLITFIGSEALPLFAESLLASVLAFLGGPFAAIAYRGVLQLFQWFSPILPDLPWTATAVVGVLAPVIGILVVAILNREKLPQDEAESKGTSSFAGWIVVAFFAFIFSWFLSGLLGPQPILVAGRSMSPQLEIGDIVITKKVPAQSIKVNDIIRYQTEHGTAIHRVIEVQKRAGTSLFVTKGDANDSADADPVYPEQIQGKVIYVVSKIGWISIGIKNLIGRLF